MKSSADAQAQYSLGACYEKGIGVPTNLRLTAFWYQKAAKQENIDAKTRLKNLQLTRKLTLQGTT
jgi:TPR repeat protein